MTLPIRFKSTKRAQDILRKLLKNGARIKAYGFEGSMFVVHIFGA